MSPINFLVDLTVYKEEIKNVKYIKKNVLFECNHAPELIFFKNRMRSV